MSSRNLSRSIVVCLLAVTLAGPAVAQVHSAGPKRPVHTWEWLTGLWQWGVTNLAPRNEASEKQGYGIDPNGGPTVGSPGASSQSDGGMGIDPNGSPRG
jgi:hypothetical protein